MAEATLFTELHEASESPSSEDLPWPAASWPPPMMMSEPAASQKRAAVVLAKMDPKQARNNIIQSKRLLNEIPLVSWRLYLHRLEYLTSFIDTNLAIIESKVDKMKFLVEPRHEEQRNEILVVAEETLDFMQRSRLLLDAVIDSKIQAMEHVLREHDLEPLPFAAETTIADIDDKVIFYARDEDVANEMDDLRGQLTIAKQHLNSESKEKAAETPLDVHLAVVFIKNMLARAYDAEEKTLGFKQHLDDPLEIWPLNTEVQLEKVIFMLKERYYRELFPKTFCATCLEEKIDGMATPVAQVCTSIASPTTSSMADAVGIYKLHHCTEAKDPCISKFH